MSVKKEQETTQSKTTQEATQTEETLQGETTQEAPQKIQPHTLQPTRERGVRRVQVSVYVKPETYRVLKLIERATGQAISEKLAELADKYADRNTGNASKAESVLSKLSELNFE